MMSLAAALRSLTFGFFCLVFSGSTFAQVLTSDVTVFGSVAQGQSVFYSINVLPSQSVYIYLQPSSGDADLAVRWDVAPTFTSPTDVCLRQETGLTGEVCNVARPNGGTLIIGVNGYRASSFSLKASLIAVTTLVPNSTQSGSLSADFFRVYRMDLTAGSAITLDLRSITGNVNLYARWGSLPTQTSADICASANLNGADTCLLSTQTGTLYVVSVAPSTPAVQSAFSLTATMASVLPTSEAIVANATYSGSVAASTYRYYSISLPAGQPVTIAVAPLSGDPDLYVGNVTLPTTANFTFQSNVAGMESVSFTPPDTRIYYIGVYGFPSAATATYTLRVNTAATSGFVYRIYSPVTNSYFLTTDSNEYNYLATIGYRRDGSLGGSIAADAVFPGSTGGTIPLFRLYSPSLRVHFFTTDENEYNYLGRFAGYRQEGRIGNFFRNANTLTTPVYRAYNGILQRHIWTANLDEYLTLQRAGGWTGEGIIGHLLK